MSVSSQISLSSSASSYRDDFQPSKSSLQIHSNKQSQLQPQPSQTKTKRGKKVEQKLLDDKDIKKKVSEIINQKSIIEQGGLDNKSEEVYQNDFDQPNENDDENRELEEIKSEFQSEVRDGEINDEIGEMMAEESEEVVSEMIESNDPQFAKFKRNNNSGSKRDRQSNENKGSKEKSKEKSNFLKKKADDTKNTPSSKNITLKQKPKKTEKDQGKKQPGKKQSNKKQEVEIFEREVQVDQNGKTYNGLTKDQIEKHRAAKLKKKMEQEQSRKKEIVDKQQIKANQKQRLKEISQKMKKLADEANLKLKKKEEEQRKAKEGERNNQRGASRRKPVNNAGKPPNEEEDNTSIVNELEGGDTDRRGKSKKQLSVVNTELSVMSRIKKSIAKKKEFDNKIKEQLVEKLHKLKQNPKQLNHQQAKALRKQLKEDQKKRKMQPVIVQQNQQNTTKAKLLKNQIKQLRAERHKLKQRIIQQQRIKNRQQEKLKALQKQENIIILDKNKKQYTSFGLVQDLKKVKNTLQVDQIVDAEHYDISEETPIEKFTNFFFKQNYEQSEIFNILNVNDDDILTLKEIEKVCQQLKIGLTNQELKQVFKKLDYDLSGSLSKDEFDFVIGKEIESKANLKKILGKIDVQNPIEIEERILDLRARIKYMEKFVTDNEQIQEDSSTSTLMRKIQKYTTKLQKRKESTKASQSFDAVSLRQQLRLLQVQKQNEQRIGKIVKQQIGCNIKQKSELLQRKVQQQLECREKLYQLKNQFQEQELRYITLEKIVKTKQRHLAQQNLKEKEKQGEIRAATQYRNKVMNKKAASGLKGMDEHMSLLAATLMIQRNFKKKKAMRELERLKEQKRKGQANSK